MKRVLIASMLALVACGDSKNSGDDTTADANDGDATGGDGDAGVDAPPFGGTCMPGLAQCANCGDDDGDTRIDGQDLQCSGPLDNDEATFGTGIPGDNMDAINQDCFFDGNSGGGNDGCNQHVCCLLSAQDKNDCAQKLQGLVNNPTQEGNKYNKAECFAPLGTATVPAKCKMNCGPLAPPGCDCFGCCTMCDPENPSQCWDIAINPSTSPGCNTTNLDDANICKRCTKVPDCGNTECGGDSCILCPGQDPSTLPQECMGDATCPTGTQECGTGGTCPTGTYCSNNCCVGVIQ